MSDRSRSEEAQLRLENDEHLVKIVTIHKSKGLQYPIVFCPFVWDGQLWAEKNDMPALHDPENQVSTRVESAWRRNRQAGGPTGGAG